MGFTNLREPASDICYTKTITFENFLALQATDSTILLMQNIVNVDVAHIWPTCAINWSCCAAGGWLTCKTIGRSCNNQPIAFSGNKFHMLTFQQAKQISLGLILHGCFMIFNEWSRVCVTLGSTNFRQRRRPACAIDCCVIARLMRYRVIHQKHVTTRKSHKSVEHTQQVH